MDLSTGHMAYSVHAQDARRAAQELEHRRIAKERAEAHGEAPSPARAPRSPFVFPLFRSHRATAQ
jgi:hypothetical protein